MMQYPMLYILSVTNVPLPGAVARPIISKFTTWTGFKRKVLNVAARQDAQRCSPSINGGAGTIDLIDLLAIHMHPTHADVVSHPAGHHPLEGGQDNPMAEFEAKMEKAFGNGWDAGEQ